DAPALFTWEERAEAARTLARHCYAAVLLSGPEDIISDGENCWCVFGGSAQSARVTGAGCMLSVLCGAFAAVEPNGAEAALLASSFWKACSQQAAGSRGSGSYHIALLDAASTLTTAEFSAAATWKKL
ncbi:protein containing Hydroxyethylthiazole kinase domain protein, partial [gut metagenome]